MYQTKECCASKVIEDPDPGLLAFRDKEGADPDNLTCAGGKKMKITINVEDYTYTIKEDLPEHMYTLSNTFNKESFSLSA